MSGGYERYSLDKMSEYDKLDYQKGSKGLFCKIWPNTILNPYNEALTIAEIDFVSRVESLGIEIKPLHNDASRATKDFRFLGHDWELKTPITVSEMIIRNVIYKATDQEKSYIVLDVSFLPMKMSEVIEKVKKHLGIKVNNDKVEGLIIARGYHLIRYK